RAAVPTPRPRGAPRARTTARERSARADARAACRARIRARARRAVADRRISSLDATSQALETSPDPALHGAERRRERAGDLFVREAVEIREADGVALHRVELVEAVLEPPRVRIARGERREIAVRRVVVLGHVLARIREVHDAAAAALDVDRAVARDA